MLTHTKRTIRVTLDVECYDDLDIESYDWNDVLGLEGDECVSATVEEIEPVWWEQWTLSKLAHDPLTGVFLCLPDGRIGGDVLSSARLPHRSSDFL